jgi:hypothetical protein
MAAGVEAGSFRYVQCGRRFFSNMAFQWPGLTEISTYIALVRAKVLRRAHRGRLAGAAELLAELEARETEPGGERIVQGLCTGNLEACSVRAGGDNGTNHKKNWLKFTPPQFGVGGVVNLGRGAVL